MRGTRLCFRLWVEGLSDHRKNLWDRVAARLAGVGSAARANFYAGHEGGERTRREHFVRAGCGSGWKRARRASPRCEPGDLPACGEYARPRGIVLADTKFEFGLLNDELIWIDEALTPDSSRFWPADGYQPGGPQPSFDKQFVRDYLESIHWPKTPPGPELPAEVVAATRGKYREAYRILTGRELN